MKDKHKQKHLDMDVTFEKIKSENGHVIAPRSKLVQKGQKYKEKKIIIDLDNTRAYNEKTELLLGQTSNYIWHILEGITFWQLSPAQCNSPKKYWVGGRIAAVGQQQFAWQV